jgi:polyhydroxybutyrate depolymerase
MLRRVALAVVLLAAIFSPDASRAGGVGPGEHERSLVHDGRTRFFLLIVPPQYDGRAKLPLLLALHGGGGNARNAEAMSQLTAKAKKDGFLLVYPEGTGRASSAHKLLTWNVGDCCGYAQRHRVDDVGFIRALLRQLKSELAVDETRVFAAGMSNGAMMAYRLGCELADEIAGIAPIAGAMNGACRPSRPVTVAVFHGTADEHVLYNGGSGPKQVQRGRVDRPVRDAVDFWTKHNGCTGEPQRQQTNHVRIERYDHCRDGVGVALYTIEGGGHAWPGGTRGWRGGDEPTAELSANDALWDFFTAHGRPRSTGN